MARRQLVVIYHNGQQNDGITETDYNHFYQHLKAAEGTVRDLKVSFFPAPNIQMLRDHVSDLIREKDTDELYLHFSGHGNNQGIPYKDLMLVNAGFANLLEHYKVKFCFFSSCSSGELVKIVNERKIPVVVGALGNNAISNDYAIKFQKRFYKALFESRTFENAFAIALDEINQQGQLQKAERLFVRGEGGKIIAEEKLNELQIVFDQSRNRSKMLIPPDFIKEIMNADITKPFLLSVFDNALTQLEFQQQFDSDHVLSQNVTHINIPADEFHLLNAVHTKDVLSSIYSRLVIFNHTNTSLHPEIILHTMNLNSVNEIHYRPLFAIKNDVDKQKVLGDNIDFNQKIGGNVLRYDSIHDLLNGPLSDQLIPASIPYSLGRKIVLSINSKPLKNELYEIVNPTKFLRVFLGLTKNEKLINFLVNGLMDSKKLKCKPIRIANAVDNTTSYIDDFKQTVRHRYSDQNFKIALGKMFAEGNIILFVDHQIDPNSQLSHLKEALEIIYSKTEDFEDQVPSKATYVFFLFENEIPLGADERKFLALRKFSMPLPIDALIIDEWRQKHMLESTDQIANVIKEVAESIQPDDYAQHCPSAVIIQICKLMKLPQQKIVNV